MSEVTRLLPLITIVLLFLVFAILVIVYWWRLSIILFVLSLLLWAYAWQRKRSFTEYERVMNSVGKRSPLAERCLRFLLRIFGFILNLILNILWKCYEPVYKKIDKMLLDKYPKEHVKLHRCWEHILGCCVYASARVVAAGDDLAETKKAKALVNGPAPSKLKSEAQEAVDIWKPLIPQADDALRILEKAHDYSDFRSPPFSTLRSLAVAEQGKRIEDILKQTADCDTESVPIMAKIADGNLGKEAQGEIDQKSFFAGAGQMEQITTLLSNLTLAGASLADKELKSLQSTLNSAAIHRLRWALPKGHKEIRYAISCAQALNALDLPEVKEAVSRYKKLRELPQDWDILAMITQKHGGYRLVAKKAVRGSVMGLANVPGTLSHALQKLMDDTFIAKYTKDRKGGDVPQRLVLLRATAVQNEQNFVEYVTRRKKIREEIKAKPLSGSEVVHGICDPKTMLSAGVTKLQPLDLDVQESWLWHGTTKAGAEGISSEDFRINLAGSGAGTLYGRGVYLAEACTKSDEYCTEENGERHLLLCRATLGRVHYTDQVRPDTNALEQSCLSGPYHSVLGDREKSRGTFREFIVYDDDQVYPAFVICYRRQYYSEAAQP